MELFKMEKEVYDKKIVDYRDIDKEVKKEVKSKNLYLTIFNLIKEGKRPSEILGILKISKQNLQYYINYLKDNGFIKKIGYGTWEVKKEVKTFSIGKRAEKPTTNLHALNIKIPILWGKIKDDDWQIKNKLNNWLPKYKELNVLGGINIRNNNNKSITIFTKSRDLKKLEEVDNLAFKIRAYIYEFFKKQGVILDVFNAETKNINLATEDKQAESMIRKGEKFELDLKKKSEKIFTRDDIDAKAWIDGTPFEFSAETNDKEWKREYLGMPFRVRDIMGTLYPIAHNLAYVAENYKSHVKLVKKASKVMDKLNKKLSQTDLRKYL